MHIHKSDDTLLLLGYSSRAGRPALTVTVAYVCGADGARITEQDAWSWLMPLFPDEAFDLSEKKTRGGFGVAGEACAPAGGTVEGLTVRAGVGDLERKLLAQGDRVWTRNPTGWRATPCQPFQRMPIGLARAYGGAEWRDNPYGRGHCANTDEFEGVPLPNIELPDQPMLKPGDTPATATLGPHSIGSTLRTQWLGAVDEAWQRNRLPWLPDDTDPRWFDRFDPQQCQAAYWRGDEPWFAENMHPQHSMLRGRLPGLRPRLLMRTVAQPDRHLELELDLDTVWLMPNDQRTIVMYRSQFGVKREDAEDILGLAAFTESQTEPPHSLEHWSQIWREAVDQDAIPMPAVPVPVDPEALARIQAAQDSAEQEAKEFEASLTKEVTQELQDAEAEASDHLRSVGFDVGALRERAAKETPFDFDPPADLILPDQPDAYAAALKSHIEGEIKLAEAKVRTELEKQGFDVDALQAHAQAHSSTEPDVVAMVAASAGLLPMPESERQAHIQAFTDFQKEMDGLEGKLEAQFEQARKEAVASAPSGDTYGGRQSGMGDLPDGPREPLSREALLERMQSGESTAWIQLEDLDLSGLDLHAADLRGSILRRCDLRGAILSNADLTEALLVDCNLSQAKLEQAHLTQAQIEGCTLHDAHMAATNFSGARIATCAFSRSQLDTSIWDDAQVTESGFDTATLKGASGERATFTNCPMTSIDASGSQFKQTSFEQCALDGAIFNNAQLTGSTLLACQASRAQFDAAGMPGLRTLMDTRMDGANLRGADLQDASLQHTSFTQANLREARLDRALLKACDLSGTDAWRMVAHDADFTDSRISGANWRGANLMNAIFREAQLLDTDLSGANLHAAQTRTATTQGLKLDQALLTRCRLLQEYDHG
ncbi:MAG: DUF2169 domain-containing protein [Alcaligenaceae bacterium]|nr:DUF2169 domain-containing protein [Alcaligenaceae bacterium]